MTIFEHGKNSEPCMLQAELKTMLIKNTVQIESHRPDLKASNCSGKIITFQYKFVYINTYVDTHDNEHYTCINRHPWAVALLPANNPLIV